ncbi:MAG TPA: hypothetical protein VG367_01115 [Mucilaginibacter sp.]|jgi:hypothetical protein|nr:hypothetical protein [Mucilaginibacter sp.]
MLSREEKIGLFTKLIETVPTVELKGDTIPYCSLNGHMYCYLSKEGLLALRLPAELRQQFLETYNTTLMTAYGIVQREYVVVPDDVLENIEELQPWFHNSHLHVGLLKPKPTKTKKKD